jgi:hypothetical protein
MNRLQRKMQEKYLKAIEKGFWWRQELDPEDARYALVSYRIPNGNMPTDRYEGLEARDRLDRFRLAYLAGATDARRLGLSPDKPLPKPGDPASRAAWQQALQDRPPVRPGELDEGMWWTQKADPADERFVLIAMRIAYDGTCLGLWTGLAGRNELDAFCRRLAAAAELETH